MIKLRTVPALVLLMAALAGCGGGGGGSSHTGDGSGGGSGNPLQNSYVGTYDSPTLGDNGTIDLEVSASGTVTGAITSTPHGADGTVSGTITAGGVLTGTMQVTGHSAGTLSGTLVQQPDGKLIGTVQETLDGVTGDVTFTLVPLF